MAIFTIRNGTYKYAYDTVVCRYASAQQPYFGTYTLLSSSLQSINTQQTSQTAHIHRTTKNPTMMNLLQHTRQLSVRSLMGGSISSRRTTNTEHKSTSKKTSSTRKRRPKSSTAAAATMQNSSTIPIHLSSGESSAETEKTTPLELSHSSSSSHPQEQQEHRRQHRKHRSKKSLLDNNSSSNNRHHRSSRRSEASEDQKVPKQPGHGLLMGGSSRSHHAVHDPNASSRTLLSSSKQERSRRNVRRGLESSSDLIASMWSSHQELPLMSERQQQRQKGPPVTTHGRHGIAKALSVSALVSSSTASTSDAPKVPPTTCYKKGTTTTRRSPSKKTKSKTGPTFMSRLRDEMVQPPHDRPATLHQHTTSSSRDVRAKTTPGWSYLVHVPTTSAQHCNGEPRQELLATAASPPPEMKDLLVHRPADDNISPENTVNGSTSNPVVAAAVVAPPPCVVAPVDNSFFCIGMIIEVPEDFDGSDI